MDVLVIRNERQQTERPRGQRGGERPARAARRAPQRACRRTPQRWAAVVCAFALSFVLRLAFAGPRPDSSQGPPPSIAVLSEPDLSQAVPSDVSLYFHARMPTDSVDGASALALVEVGRALSTASFIAPFASYLDEVVLARKRRALEPELEYWRKLLESRSWWRLFRHEFFLAGRFEVFRRAWLMGFRVAPEDCEPFLSTMHEMLEAFAAIIPGSELDVGQRDGSRIACLYRMFDPSLVEFCVAGGDGLILVSTSRSLLRHSMQLLSGESSDVSFALSRAAEVNAADVWSSERSSLAWLSSQSRFLSAHAGLPSAEPVLRSAAQAESVAGFELMVKPLALFADVLGDDPLLSDWKSLNVAGDFRKEGIRCYFDTDLPAGQEELERALYRALVEPIERLRLGPILYREVEALLPRQEEELEPPEVTVLVRELAKWLKSGIDVLDPGGRHATSKTVTDRGGAKRLRGDATFPLVIRESARKR